MKRTGLSILLFLGAISVVAAPSKKSIKSYSYVPYVKAIEPDLTMPDTTMIKESDFEKEMQEAKKRGQREIASDLSGEIKKDFADFRDRVLRLKDTPGSSAAANELDQILFELENMDANATPDLRFFAAQMAPLRSFRGFFHKVRKLAKGYPVVQSYLVTMAKQMASNVDIFLTDENSVDKSEHMKVLFRYIAEPYTYNVTRTEKVKINFKNKDDLKKYGIQPFDSELDIQNWLMVDVYPRIENSIRALMALNLKAKPAIWDNKIIAGTEAYEDNIDRYRAVGEAEKNSVISNFNGNLSSILMYCAYSNEGSLALMRQLGFLYGVEEMERFNLVEAAKDMKKGSRDVNLKGASALERTKKIKEFLASQKNDKAVKYNLFTLLPNGREKMKIAYARSLESNAYANLAWNEIRSRKNDEDMALDGAIFRPFSRASNKSLKVMTDVLKGRLTPDKVELARTGKLNLSADELSQQFQPIRSAISGDVIHTNVIRFFFDPPASLAAFLPEFSEKSIASESVELTSDVPGPSGKNMTYRNYFYGTAKEWIPQNFNPYFRVGTRPTDITSSKDVKAIIRVTNQSWGGLMVGMSLSSILL